MLRLFEGTRAAGSNGRRAKGGWGGSRGKVSSLEKINSRASWIGSSWGWSRERFQIRILDFFLRWCPRPHWRCRCCGRKLMGIGIGIGMGGRQRFLRERRGGKGYE